MYKIGSRLRRPTQSLRSPPGPRSRAPANRTPRLPRCSPAAGLLASTGYRLRIAAPAGSRRRTRRAGGGRAHRWCRAPCPRRPFRPPRPPSRRPGLKTEETQPRTLAAGQGERTPPRTRCRCRRAAALESAGPLPARPRPRWAAAIRRPCRPSRWRPPWIGRRAWRSARTATGAPAPTARGRRTASCPKQTAAPAARRAGSAAARTARAPPAPARRAPWAGPRMPRTLHRARPRNWPRRSTRGMCRATRPLCLCLERGGPRRGTGCRGDEAAPSMRLFGWWSVK
eukprot:scaffold29403_cov130-Isochrysis_galbana.AAC.3